MAGSGRSPPRSSAERLRRTALAGLASLLLTGSDAGLAPYEIVGDAIPVSLTGRPGDPVQGRAIVTNRQVGLCLLCHSGPFPEQVQQGNLAPSLAGAGAQLSPGQLRLRIVDAGRLNADTIMPPYYRTAGLSRVAAPYIGKPILSAEQVEDVVAFLATLTE
ncbi:MAG TPA: sulfur oxidation c-type cytochrome SoxX [Stellaceae bacterium]|jgi:sulfur-oxidizing protein SoxX|nr:sulfur oxidation c-type cytochrome SoxX [Stellaceae bacterium]